MSCKLGYVCINNYVGLCNRLNILIGDMRIASDYYKKPFYLYWRKLKYEFSELFDSDIILIEKDDIDDDLYLLSTDSKISGIVQCPVILDTDRHFFRDNFNFGDTLKKSIHEMYSNTPKDIIKIYLRYVNMLKPTKEIELIVNKHSKKFDENTVSVHVRRGDFCAISTRNKNTDDKYFDIMDYLLKKNPKATFFVSSDDQNTQNIYKKKYGDIIYTYDHNYAYNSFPTSNENQSEEKEALISLLLLSKNNILIATHKSTYSQMAWWFGQCKASVYVVK